MTSLFYFFTVTSDWRGFFTPKLHKQQVERSIKGKNSKVNRRLQRMALEYTQSAFQLLGENQPVVDPSGKPMMPHLLRCQGFAVGYYSFTLGALDLQHPRLLHHWGLHDLSRCIGIEGIYPDGKREHIGIIILQMFHVVQPFEDEQFIGPLDVTGNMF